MKHPGLFSVLFSVFVIVNLSGQENSSYLQKKTHVDYYELDQKLPGFINHKNETLLNNTETILDSSIYFLFETNYDSSSIYKDEYEYNALGLLSKWEFYKRGWQERELPWYVYFYITYEYDDNNNLIEQIYTRWIESLQEYRLNNKYVAIYNDEDLRIKYDSYKWDLDISDWFLEGEHFYEYDSLGNNIYYERWRFDYPWNEYRPTHRYYLEYDGNNNLTQSLRHVWDRENSLWKNLDILSYYYDDQQNHVLYTVSYWNKYLELWWEGKKEEMDYNNDNLKIKRSFFERDSDTVEWQIIKNFDFDYNNELRLVKLEKSKWVPDSMRLVNTYVNLYEYDENGFLKDDFVCYWIIDTVHSHWKMIYNHFYENDSTGNVLLNGRSSLDSLGFWNFDNKEYHYYSSLTTGMVRETNTKFIVSPNPSNRIFTVSSYETKIEKIDLYNLESVLIYSEILNSNIGIIDLSIQKPGLYILQLTFRNGMSQSQIIVKM